MIIKLFSAGFCQPCKMLKKSLEELEVSYEVVDIDEEPQTAQKFRVRGVPTLMKVKDDGTVDGSLVGMQNKDTLKEFFEVV